MSLQLSQLSFQNFRNYPAFELTDIGRVTIFIGPNAVGKSNIIEGIQLLTALSSFKHALTEELIQEGEDEAYLHALLCDEKRELNISLHITEKKKTYHVNGKKKQNSELKTLLPAVVFTPDDLDLVKGSQTKRRAALDALGCQISDAYASVRRDFETILRQKNSLLKDEVSPGVLESVNDVFLTCATQLTYYRRHLFGRFLPYLIDNYSSLVQGDEQLSAVYSPSWVEDEAETFDAACCERETIRAALEASLVQRMDEEFARKHAVVGPQADKITFFIDSRSATQYGSQGQQRSIVLAWKLAEINLIESMMQQKPILLLDDVMSELDASRRAALTRCIKDATQVFITTTNLEYFDQNFIKEVQPVYLPK